MSRYIDADNIEYTPAVENGFYRNENHGVSGEFTISMFTSKDHIDAIPTAEVEPVRHGHWIFAAKDNEHNYFVCSECRERVITAPYETLTVVKIKFPYSHCGAKMDEEVKK